MLRTTRSGGIRGPHREHHAASVEPTPKTHPRLFTADGQRKWKVPPAGAQVEQNVAGNGTWIERWQAPAKKGQPTRWVYNYTLAEVQRRAGIKFAENRELATKLPAIRAQLEEDLGGKGKAHEVAMAITLIDRLYLRVGGEDSVEHEHFGTTTLQKKHVTVSGDTVRLRFTGKSGVDWDVSLKDAKYARLMRAQLAHAGGGPEAQVFKISADDVNAYLKPFGATAKKFRTFHATRLAREDLLEHAKAPVSQREKIVSEMVVRVAARLGHTPAVSRESYIDPMVIQAFLKGRLA